MNFMNKLRQFMYGRYGMDQLGAGIAVSYFILTVLSNLFRFWPIMVLTYALFFIWIFRILSKNIYQRQKENTIFLSKWNPVKGKFALLGKRMSEGKQYRFYRCPSCKQMIRVPKGKGRISITCPKCKTEFIKKT